MNQVDISSRDLHTEFTLKDCLSEAVKLTKNAGPYRYSRFEYGTGFPSRSIFLISNFWFWKICYYFWCKQ